MVGAYKPCRRVHQARAQDRFQPGVRQHLVRRRQRARQGARPRRQGRHRQPGRAVPVGRLAEGRRRLSGRDQGDRPQGRAGASSRSKAIWSAGSPSRRSTRSARTSTREGLLKTIKDTGKFDIGGLPMTFWAGRQRRPRQGVHDRDPGRRLVQAGREADQGVEQGLTASTTAKRPRRVSSRTGPARSFLGAATACRRGARWSCKSHEATLSPRSRAKFGIKVKLQIAFGRRRGDDRDRRRGRDHVVLGRPSAASSACRATKCR